MRGSKFFTVGLFLPFLFFLFAAQASFGQQELNFASLSTRDGLSSNTINAIIKDKYGLMWFATADGLDRFDGTNFTVYRHHAGDTTSIPADEIQSLYQDRSGKLWIGTAGGSLAYYDRNQNSFSRYQGDSFWRSSTSEGIRAICQDHNGKLWVASYSGLRVIDLKTNKTTTFIFNSLQTDMSKATIGLNFYEDRYNRMWVGTTTGLLLYDEKAGKFIRFVHDDKDKGSLSNDLIRSINEDTLGRLWFGTNDGLNLLQPDGRTFAHFMQNTGETAPYCNIYAIATDQSDLWVATENGLAILDLHTFKTRFVTPAFRDVFSLSDKFIKSIYIDPRGIYWLGTFEGGIDKYDKNLALFSLKIPNPFDPYGLMAPAVTSFTQYNQHQVFVATDNGGVQLFDLQTGLFRKFSVNSERQKTDKPLSVLSLKYDSHGNLWIGTFHEGLFVLNITTGSCRHFTAGKSDNQISENDVFCIEESPDGHMWIGTNGGGIDIYDPKSGKFARYDQVFDLDKVESKVYLNKYLRAITIGKNGDMWAATYGGGIYVFNFNTKAAKVYNKANSALPTDAILSLLYDKKTDMVWAGTNGGGLCRLDPATRKIVAYSEKEGISNDIVCEILKDNKGLLWLSTNKGINSFDPATRRFNVYTHQNGVQDVPFISGSGLKMADGTLFFGCQDGFNYFNPPNFAGTRSPSPVMFTDLKVSNNSVNPGKQSPISEQIAVAKEIRLKFGQNFSISYITVNYTDAHQDKYSYILKGFDKEWNYVGKATTAYYTNIDPGTYEFLVRASDGRGHWSEKPTSIKVTILPPWWRNIYAYIIYFCIAVGMLFYIRHRGILKLKREMKIEEDKRAIERVHELDRLKIKFLTNLSHEFRTPISLIMAPVDKLMSINTGNDISKEINLIGRNARRLLNLVNQLLDFKKMEEKELRLNLSTGDLIGFIRETVYSFQDISEHKHIHLDFICEQDSLPAYFDPDKIERILFNLLSNAFKFTGQGGEIVVKLCTADNEDKTGKVLKLKISDTGVGIPESEREKIFQRFYQVDTSRTSLNQGSGIGLSIAREFVQLHGGTIDLAGKEPHGSVFTVMLPILPAEINDTVLSESAELQYIAEESLPLLSAGNAGEGPVTEKTTILIVEDNEELRDYLKYNLSDAYKIFEATNGKDGWQKVLSCHPDLILTDVSMPYMDGIELCNKIKNDKRTSFLPVILLTAHTTEEDQLKGLETGANDYLTKPFSLEVLNAKIRNLIQLNQKLKTTYSKQIHVIAPEIYIESADEKLLNKVALFVEEKLNDPDFSIEELSRYLGMSRSSLYNKLFELTGVAPVEYVRAIKLQKAAVLLDKSQYTIREIAFMTGFGTPGYFSKLFKEKYDLSPSEFKDAKRKAAEVKVDTANV